MFNGFLDLLLGSDHVLFHTSDGVGDNGRRLGGGYGFNGLGSRCFGFLGQTLGLALTTTHFTRVVGGAAGAGRRLNGRLDLGCSNRSFLGRSCGRRFCHGFGGGSFNNRSFHRGRGLFYRRSLFGNRGSFNGFGYHNFCGRRFNDGFGNRGFRLGWSFSGGFGNHFSGNHSGSGHGSGLDGVGRSGLFGTFLIRAQLFAIGFALTLATVAATTLATGTATGTLAIGAFLIVVLQQLFVVQQFFVDYLGLGGFGTRLALLAGLTLFTRLAFFAGRTLSALATLATAFLTFAGFTRLTLFAGLTLFARLALFTRLTFFTWLAGLTLFARLAFFAGRTLAAITTFAAFATTFLAFTGFARLAFFTWLAIFLATAFTTFAAITTAVLLAAVAALVTARLALGGRLLGFDLGFFLAGEQAHEGLHQALEQTRLRSRCRRRQRGCRSRGRGRALGGYGLHRGFLAYQGAGGADRLGFLDLGGGHFVAGLVALHFRAVVAQALDFEMRGFQMVVRQDDDA
ncbi:hypothetical protein D9M72_256320 [compost metagenome]